MGTPSYSLRKRLRPGNGDRAVSSCGPDFRRDEKNKPTGASRRRHYTCWGSDPRMKSKLQTSVLQDGVHPSSAVSLTSRRLTAAVALGLALMYAPTMAMAQDTTSQTAGTTAPAPAKPDA